MDETICEYNYRGMKLPQAALAEGLLVVSLRLWLLERVCRRNSAIPDWRGGLRAIGLPHLARDVVEPLFEFLYGNRKGVEVMPLCCGRISREESNLLTCVLLMQQGRAEDVRRLVASYTFPATARVVTALLARFATALEDAGMALPPRFTEWKGRPQTAVHLH